MSDDGPAAGAPAAPVAEAGGAAGHSQGGLHSETRPKRISTHSPVIEDIASLTSPRLFTPNPFSRKNTSLDIDDYFVSSS